MSFKIDPLGFADTVVSSAMDVWKQDKAEGMAEDAQNFNAEQAAAQRTFSAAEAKKQRDWSERMSSTAYRRSTKDMMAAGLNPMLAYHQGGASSPSGSAASGAAASAGTPSAPGLSHRSGIAANMQSAAQVRLIDAEEDKVKAEAAEIRARTPTHAVSIAQMMQNISESKERVNKIMAETTLTNQQERSSAAQQHLWEQQRTNLREEVARIRAQVEGIKAGAIKDLSAASQMSAHENEIRQRIRENLPEIERKLKDLDEKTKGLDLHRQGMEAAARSSWLGAWNAAIRALTGQK